jgi:hypothetical protein
MRLIAGFSESWMVSQVENWLEEEVVVAGGEGAQCADQIGRSVDDADERAGRSQVEVHRASNMRGTRHDRDDRGQRDDREQEQAVAVRGLSWVSKRSPRRCIADSTGDGVVSRALTV